MMELIPFIIVIWDYSGYAYIFVFPDELYNHFCQVSRKVI